MEREVENGSGEADTRRHYYWPSLDGLRGVAVLLVMVYHLGYRVPVGGFLGVDVFFVLSGFLITTLLINEFAQRQTVAFGYFYARRALRLLPALAAVCLITAVLVELRGTGEQQHHTFVGVPLVLLYVVNWAMALGHVVDAGWLSPHGASPSKSSSTFSGQDCSGS